ncbi:antibiotic biosynthesis monooxygenase [Yoonia sp. I 8.24]|uniref:antibiotic biosynthesis monooxygenase family protein n=1 Tax=Yoonia sp. I 8.24 TaxID=1537229 RepID=UPI001EE0C965|nr:antibiotic biosynthesis monooxygenase [Yoonia sp. I 8.24]MCG3266653.1 antibiotic biosynthesis monooxygenase [Yoonia sp. I 8.24]
MIAVIFEVTPAQGQKKAYLDHAAKLRPLLEKIPGFISVTRFQSLANADTLLSLSFFEDEDAVAAWRNSKAHRESQSAGRSGVFADYRIRIATVSRDYGLHDRAQAPTDSNQLHL